MNSKGRLVLDPQNLSWDATPASGKRIFPIILNLLLASHPSQRGKEVKMRVIFSSLPSYQIFKEPFKSY